MPSAQETNMKARKVYDAFEKAAIEYNREGDEKTSNLLMKARRELPVGSAARLFDILTKVR